jgi:SAM-dependent methyltransferase
MSKVFDIYAEYYDLLYQDKDYKQEVDYVAGLLAENGVKSGAILELGSGTGKHAEEFARKRFSVNGVDLSPVMVKEANQRKKDIFANLLHFNVGDVRTYRVEKKFDAVISLFHVMSYQTQNEDIIAMFETAARHLKTGGVFIFDYWNGSGVLTNPPEIRIKRLENEKIEVLRIAEPEMHSNENVVYVNYSVQVKSKLTDGGGDDRTKGTT